jgi:hypothetical protein
MTLDLDKLEALLAKATPGPWTPVWREMCLLIHTPGRERHAITVNWGDTPANIPNYGTKEQSTTDARLIAAAINALPDLLAMARRTEAAEAKVKELEAENTRIRAAFANSDHVCVYCSLPAADWAKCQYGFPGCERGEDALGCAELGASLALKDAEAHAKALADALEQIEADCEADYPPSHGAIKQAARAALATYKEAKHE